MAKLLTRYSTHHPQLEFSRIVIPQVPGSMPRSSSVHGVVDAFFTSKKYIVPSAVVSPIFAGCVFAVYVGTGASRFEPAHNAMVFVVGSEPQAPLDREDLRAYRLELKHLLAETYSRKPNHSIDKNWERLQSKAKTTVDAEGRPVLEVQVGDDVVEIGASADNVLNGNAPPQIVRQLLEARLASELRRRQHGVTETEVARDWKLLQQSLGTGEMSRAPRSAHVDNLRGSAP